MKLKKQWVWFIGGFAVLLLAGGGVWYALRDTEKPSQTTVTKLPQKQVPERVEVNGQSNTVTTRVLPKGE